MTTTAQITLCQTGKRLYQRKKEKRRKKEKQMRATIWRGPGKAAVNHHLEGFSLTTAREHKGAADKIKCKVETEKMIEKTKE